MYPPVVTSRLPRHTLSAEAIFSRDGSSVTRAGHPAADTSRPVATASLWTIPSGEAA